jgi:sugar phosphate isomerase/epimerase
MALDSSSIAYCTNLHPAATLGDLMTQLDAYALPLVARLGRPLAVGLWLPHSALQDSSAARIADFAKWLDYHGLICRTMNAFPFGDFHGTRVKHAVYEPDWTTADRCDYTCRVADFLAALLPPGAEGSISTLPLGWRGFHAATPTAAFFPMIFEAIRHLVYLKERTGKTIRLALEPEPGCLLERTDDALRFFKKLWMHATNTSSADDPLGAEDHLGVCFDVCHAAVMHEDPAAAIRKLAAVNVRIVKVQLSSALELAAPADKSARKFLAKFVEPRYLHQTTAKLPSGTMLFADDLTTVQALMPPPEWLAAPNWRVHYHVPIHATEIGPLHTTANAVAESLPALAELPYAPDLEVETYTWNVLPHEGRAGAAEIVDGLEKELRFAAELRARQRAL